MTITFEIELRYDPDPDDDDPSPEEHDVEEALRRYLAATVGLAAPVEIRASRQ